MSAVTILDRAPATMLGLAARQNRRELKEARRSPRSLRLRRLVRMALGTVALVIGFTGFSMGSAQAYIWDDLKNNIASTIVNVCQPNDVPALSNYANIDTLAGLNQNPTEGIRATVKPNFGEERDIKGGNGLDRLNGVYKEQADIIKPTYERYGFSTLRWTQYGYGCFSPSLLMGPASNIALTAMVHVPMMISMAVLNFVMDNSLYTAFASLMQPFIGAMYAIFNPWIYFLVPIGIGITWLASKGSLQATLKATGWGVFMLAVFLLMGASTSKVVTWATNAVTEVAGTAACKINAASEGKTTDATKCDTANPMKAVNQSLWYGIPYQTWLIGQVGDEQAEADNRVRAADDATGKKASKVTWGAALLNGQYVGVMRNEDGSVGPDKEGQKLLAAADAWNHANYNPDSEDGKVTRWTEKSAWNEVPYLANVKIMCNDVGAAGNKDREPSEKTRWMYSGNGGTDKDGKNLYCDSAGAGTQAMIPYVTGEEYNKRFLVAMSGMIGVGAVALTVAGSAIYLGFQKMMFFFLLFLAPIVLTVSSLGDRKRRPFAIRYAELVLANLLKQVAAVCIVLFVGHAMSALFGSTTFNSVPWVMKPYAALLFFLALIFLAFPIKSIVQGAIRGDTAPLDKVATMPQRTLKTAAKVVAVGTAVAATGGVAAAVGGGSVIGGLAGAGGKAGAMLGHAGRVMGIGSKTGRILRGSGALLKAGQGVMESRDTWAGQNTALGKAAEHLMNGPNAAKYRDPSGKLLPNAQKMAKRDAQKLVAMGERTARATKAQDAHMKAFFQGYPDEHGETHRDDPSSPKNKRRPSVRPEGRTAGWTVRPKRRGHSDDDEWSPKLTPFKAANASAPDASTDDEDVSFDQTRERYREKARENLTGPAFSREMEYKVSTVRSGDDVLTKAGLSLEDVIANPTKLLTGEAYEGGSTVKMDPFHPATQALSELRLLAPTADEAAMESAVARAVDAINAHGVPDQISSVHSIGPRAEAFEPIQLLGAMPHLDPESSWADRAKAAHTMMAAQVAMPENYPAREAVQEYTAALANPGVEAALVDPLKDAAVTAVGRTMMPGATATPPTAADPLRGESAPVRGSQPPAHAPATDPTAQEHTAPADKPVSTKSSRPPAGAPAPAAGEFTAPIDPPASVSDAGSYAAPVNAPPSRVQYVRPADAPAASSAEQPYFVETLVRQDGVSTPSSANTEPTGDRVAREDLRDAVADGIREARLEHDAADVPPSGMGETGHASDQGRAAGMVPDPDRAVTGAPDPRSSVAGSSVFNGGERSTPDGAEEAPVEAVLEGEGIFFRPPTRRRRRSPGLFGHDGGEDGNDQTPEGGEADSR